MYDNLVETLRFCAKNGECHDCPYEKPCAGMTGDGLYCEAADAIEKLDREYESVSKSLNEAVELVRKLQKPRWIPVTERLPGREWVLCKCRAKTHEVLSLRDGYWYHDPQHQYMSGFVTHWMPLPAPPKEET